MTEQATAQRDGSWLWVALLTVTSAVGTLGLACAMPFVALAAVAATRMPLRAGMTLIVLTWAINQAIGFGILHYPQDARTFAWGFAILTAALAGMAGARWGDRAVAGGPVLRLATAFGVGFVAYKLALLGWSLVLGGVHTATSPYWTARQFVVEGATLAGLVALYHALVAVGVPPRGASGPERLQPDTFIPGQLPLKAIERAVAGQHLRDGETRSRLSRIAATNSRSFNSTPFDDSATPDRLIGPSLPVTRSS